MCGAMQRISTRFLSQKRASMNTTKLRLHSVARLSKPVWESWSFLNKPILSGVFNEPILSQKKSFMNASMLRCFSVARSSKPVRESWSFLREIVGNPALAGRQLRISAGEILKLVDLSAAVSAALHAGHRRCTTVSFDYLEFVTPIFHGDLVHLDARVTHVGKSSIVVHVVGRKKDLPSRGWVYAHEALVVFVALGADGRPQVVPELQCQTPEEEQMRQIVVRRLALAKQYQQEQEQIKIKATPVPEIAEEETTFRELMTMEETTLCLRRHFLPRNLNGLGTIFGGDLLEWMEGAAVTCASHFLRNTGATTIAMDRVSFHSPLHANDVTDLIARVVYCRRDTVQVETEVTVIDPFGDGKARNGPFTHTGSFTILNVSENGYRRPVTTGLRATDEASRVRYARAKHRIDFCRSNRGTEVDDWDRRRGRLIERPFLPPDLGPHFFGSTP